MILGEADTSDRRLTVARVLELLLQGTCLAIKADFLLNAADLLRTVYIVTSESHLV
jgi:hypothetical protein